jgi:hypothetical protein
VLGNLDVGREEGELQRPAELDARGDRAGEDEPGRAYAPRRHLLGGLVLVGRVGAGAVEVDELHFGVAEVAVRQADGRGAAGVHGGGRQIWGGVGW